MNDPITQAIQADPLTAATDYYASCLEANAKAVKYLNDELGLTIEEAKAKRIGFSDRSLGKQFPKGETKAGKAIRQPLVEIGLMKSTGHEALRGCITIPVFNDEGKVIAIDGKRVDKKSRAPKEVRVGDGERGRQGDEETGVLTTNDTKHTNEQPGESRIEPKLLASPATKDLTKEATADENLIVENEQVTLIVDDRRYRVRGLDKNTNAWTLKVNIMASRDDLVHLDTLDLVKARSRASFIKAAASELFVDADLIKRDIGKLLLKLENLREQQIAELFNSNATPKPVEISEQDEAAALDLLQDPNLLQRIVADIDACGIVGESTNKLAGYLAATSRKLSQPLAIVIQSSSSAGKTSLMDAVLDMMPGEEQLRYSGMTGRSLFYLDSNQIKHKTLAISEDEGIAEATYALKLLQSEGELRHATTERGENGRMQTTEYHVEGPVQIFLTTTAMDIDEELVNRCLVLSVDESKHQTDSIQAMQRESRTFVAIDRSEAKKSLRNLHQNAQRLLRPLQVINPYAPQLTFANDKTRLRRDQNKYLTLIDTIALLHQYQRPVHTRTLADGTDG